MAFTNIYDNTFPPDTQLANLLGSDLRAFRLDIQQRVAAMSGLDASKPNFAGDAQPATWNGVLFFATDTGKVYQFNNPSWTDVTANFGLNSSGVFRYTDIGGSTNGNNQVLFTITIPVGVLSVGSYIRVFDLHSFTGSAEAAIFVGGSGIFNFTTSGTGLISQLYDINVTQDTTIDITGIANPLSTPTSASAKGQAITDITTTGLVIAMKQQGTGTLGPGSFNVIAIS